MAQQLYSVSQLAEMGYPREWLRRIARSDCNSGGYYATRMGTGKNSKLLFRLDRLQAGMESGRIQRSMDAER